MRFSELKEKEVINICDCRRLGCVGDLKFDPCSGCIEKLYVPLPGKCGGLFPPEFEYVICFDQVKQIGPDIILVEVRPEEARVPCDKSKGKTKNRLEFDKW